jgi:hypothetical protein
MRFSIVEKSALLLEFIRYSPRKAVGIRRVNLEVETTIFGRIIGENRQLSALFPLIDPEFQSLARSLEGISDVRSWHL